MFIDFSKVPDFHALGLNRRIELAILCVNKRRPLSSKHARRLKAMNSKAGVSQRISGVVVSMGLAATLVRRVRRRRIHDT